MMNWMRATQRKVTDFNVGGIARTLVEAPAAEVDELYQQIFIGLKEAIPVSVYHSFEFDALPAAPASGLVTVTVTSAASAIVISAGTTFVPATGGVQYQAIQNVTISPGNTTVDVAVAAVDPGLAGNIPAETEFTLSPSPTGFISAENGAAFINGADAETEESRKARFRSYIQSLSRGTVPSLHYGMRTAFLADAAGNPIERVIYTSVVEPHEEDEEEEPGYVNCYIHNGVGSTSVQLVNRARTVLYGYYDANNNAVPGWKAAGTRVTVAAATEVPLNVTGTVSVLAGYSGSELAAQATIAVRTYILSLGIGQAALYSDLIAMIKQIAGIYDVTLSSPSANTTADSDEKLMPVTITITAA